MENGEETIDSGYISEHVETDYIDLISDDKSSSDVTDDESSEDDEDISFKNWLKNITECLQGFRKADPDKMQEEAEAEETGDETEEERCMRIVRSVLDEETALEMVKTYLQFTRVQGKVQQSWFSFYLQEADIPEMAQIEFHMCEFDPDLGNFIN